MAQWHAGGAAVGQLGEGEREEGERGHTAWGRAQPAGPDWSPGPDGRWAGGEKRKNRNLF
jgi:hypothetical protein